MEPLGSDVILAGRVGALSLDAITIVVRAPISIPGRAFVVIAPAEDEAPIVGLVDVEHQIVDVAEGVLLLQARFVRLSARNRRRLVKLVHDANADV